MKNKIITIVFLIIIFGLGIIGIVLEDKAISSFERRKLAQFPELTNDFAENMNDYLVDQFAFRNELIGLNSSINRNILKKIDDKKVYIVEDNIFEINYPLNEDSCIRFSSKLNYITEKCFKNVNVYYSIVPDKSCFLDESKYLKIDYSRMYNILNGTINAQYIDISNRLGVDDYYSTDIHWKQENLLDIVEYIMDRMGKKYVDQAYYEKRYNDFYGSSYSKGNTGIKPDVLKYLYSTDIENAFVNHLEFGEKTVYDEEKLNGIDSYDVFLSGPSSYIEIENKNVDNDNTLILFRDSFGSSIAPLFISYYNKIIIIDLRYINFKLIEEKLNYEQCDVLYLFSTLVINNSDILKVNY